MVESDSNGTLENSKNEEYADNLQDFSKVSSFPVSEKYPIKKHDVPYHVDSWELYQHLYRESLHHPEKFWSEIAYTHLRWIHPFQSVMSGSLQDNNPSWFLDGKLNVCDNCVDRWAEECPTEAAFIWEADDPSESKVISYQTLLDNVCQLANAMKSLGIRKGDTVCIFMPMIPEIAYAMLACARLGAIHSVVFAGFSATSLRERILDANCVLVITADKGIRGGKIIPLKEICDDALVGCSSVKHCIVFSRKGSANMMEGRDIWGHEIMAKQRSYCPSEIMDSEDLLFLLYTSGSTGKPKGVAHSTAGYLLYASMTFKYVFDYHNSDVFACVADCGWITGHTYVVYGPLSNGATSIIFESIPTYPDPGRYWDMVSRHKVTHFYTSPTAIRSLMQKGDSYPKKYDLSSLRILGSVGEPLNSEAWRWYHNVIGQGRCSIVDTYWQTETGGHMITPLPGAMQTKPGSATFPFFGIEPIILDPTTGKVLEGYNVKGVLCIKRAWPGMMRTIYGAHDVMAKIYLKPYPGYYFSGDGAFRDADGYIWITGRIDDTLNISGHRLSTAELEHALCEHLSVAESAVVGYPHPVTGNGIFCYIVLKESLTLKSESICNELKYLLRTRISPIATPDYVAVVEGLPKTRSGKIVRRILRKIAAGDSGDLGDLSTLADPSVVDSIKTVIAPLLKKVESCS